MLSIPVGSHVLQAACPRLFFVVYSCILVAAVVVVVSSFGKKIQDLVCNRVCMCMYLKSDVFCLPAPSMVANNMQSMYTKH